MKKVILFVCGSLIFAASFGQKNFKWEKTDTIPMTKSQLYSATKMFIAEVWKSAKDVIQNDDKEAGIIMIKGNSIQKFAVHLGFCPMEYIYGYSVTFRMKDNKYKITLDNVACTSAHGGTDYQTARPIEPSLEIPYPLKTGGNISRNKATEMMQSLKAEFQAIVDDYVIYVKKASSKSDNW
jgi:hypothetical protein